MFGEMTTLLSAAAKIKLLHVSFVYDNDDVWRKKDIYVITKEFDWSKFLRKFQIPRYKRFFCEKISRFRRKRFPYSLFIEHNRRLPLFRKDQFKLCIRPSLSLFSIVFCTLPRAAVLSKYVISGDQAITLFAWQEPDACHISHDRTESSSSNDDDI